MSERTKAQGQVVGKDASLKMGVGEEWVKEIL